MSDDMFGSVLLGHAGLSPSANLMALTSTGNVTAFDEIRDVLTPPQRRRVHIRQKDKEDSKGMGSTSPWTYRPSSPR